MIYVIFSISVIIIDRLSKIFAVKYLKALDTLPLLKGVFHLTYSENTGAAFSIFSGKTSLLAVFSAVVILLGLWFFFRQKRLNPGKRLYLFSIVSILAGAAGNLIDRAIYGFVVDYFDFRLINFAIFNVADSFITIGTIVLAACILFDKKIEL